MAQHGDPLVYNSATGNWENSSQNQTPVSVGSEGGSQAAHVPAVGATVRRSSDGAHATINAATVLSSGAASESSPAYLCVLVFYPGAANEQSVTAFLGALNGGTGAALLLNAESADSSIPSSRQVAQLGPGTAHGTTFELFIGASL